MMRTMESTSFIKVINYTSYRFSEYQGKIDDIHTWETPDEQISDEIYDCLRSEEYTS